VKRVKKKTLSFELPQGLASSVGGFRGFFFWVITAMTLSFTGIVSKADDSVAKVWWVFFFFHVVVVLVLLLFLYCCSRCYNLLVIIGWLTFSTLIWLILLETLIHCEAIRIRGRTNPQQRNLLFFLPQGLASSVGELRGVCEKRDPAFFPNFLLIVLLLFVTLLPLTRYRQTRFQHVTLVYYFFTLLPLTRYQQTDSLSARNSCL